MFTFLGDKRFWISISFESTYENRMLDIIIRRKNKQLGYNVLAAPAKYWGMGIKRWHHIDSGQSSS